MTDIQQAITRLCAADEHHPDFWQTLTDRDADPQMIRDVVAVARAYVRKETRAQHALQIIEKWSLYETAKDDHKYIANKAAEGLGGMSLRRPSHHELLSFAVLAAASLGVTMDVPLTKKQRLLPGEKPCLNCGEPKRHANAFCSSACCRDWKLKKREGLGE